MTFRALDLFCCAGGATRGLQMAGFHVTGVDIRPQPRYCGDDFHEADALTFPLEGFDFIWASPPCQAHSAMKHMPTAKEHADLIPATRERLKQSGALWIIENVPGSTLGEFPMFYLCGTMFGLGVEVAGEWLQLRRHRWFESPMRPLIPPCQHTGPTIGLYGDHARDRRRKPGAPADRGIDFSRVSTPDLARAAMEMPWADWKGISQAIPPAYAEFIGQHALDTLQKHPAARRLPPSEPLLTPSPTLSTPQTL